MPETYEYIVYSDDAPTDELAGQWALNEARKERITDPKIVKTRALPDNSGTRVWIEGEEPIGPAPATTMDNYPRGGAQADRHEAHD